MDAKSIERHRAVQTPRRKERTALRRELKYDGMIKQEKRRGDTGGDRHEG